MDWTLAHTINNTGINNQIPFTSHISLSEYPTDDFMVPGVGLAATNNYRFYTPIHGKITSYDTQKVIPKDDEKVNVKKEQTGLGSEQAIEKNNDVLMERDLKRKQLGEPLFQLMSAPKIKTVKLNLIPKPKTETKANTLPKGQKGAGKASSKVHKF